MGKAAMLLALTIEGDFCVVGAEVLEAQAQSGIRTVSKCTFGAGGEISTARLPEL